jgi:hypothetical protein
MSGTLSDVIKSVLALVVGIMLVLSSAAGYAYVRLTMTDETPIESNADPGVAACEALLAQTERDSLDDLLSDGIVTGLKASANADLQAAGSTIEALAALPPEQQPAAAPQVATVLAQIAAGCLALGVTLPDVSEQPSPSP